MRFFERVLGRVELDLRQSRGAKINADALGGRNMIIAQISDTHILARSGGGTVGKSRADNLRRCIADINRLRPDLVVHTGDIVQDGLPEEYAHICEIVAPLEMPIYFVPGNRDRRDALLRAFGDHNYFPTDGDFLHYTVENRAIRLVALDSIAAGKEVGDNKGAFCTSRGAWLDDELAQAPDRPTILLIHHPPFDVGSHYVGGYRRPREADDLAAVVSRHPQIVRLLCGHVHRSIQVGWAGTVASIMPSIAIDLRKDVDGTRAKDAPIYAVHEMSVDAGLISYSRVVAD